MRLRLFAVFPLLLAGSSVLPAERVQDLPAPTNYVNDFAGVLSPQTTASLNALCAQVDRQAHAQIAVVTIKSLDGEPIENFATALEDKWKVGKKGTDRGLLLIFATEDRKYRFEVGYGLEGILPDGRVGDIGRQMVPYLRQNDFDGAISMAVQQVAGVIAADAGVTLTAQPRRGTACPAGAATHVGSSGGARPGPVGCDFPPGTPWWFRASRFPDWHVPGRRRRRWLGRPRWRRRLGWWRWRWRWFWRVWRGKFRWRWGLRQLVG